jgi:tetratricopeptide (TPR) repeat protein
MTERQRLFTNQQHFLERGKTVGGPFHMRGARHVASGHLLLAVLLISGCAALGRESSRENELKRAVLADRSFTVDAVPADAPAHRAASLRLAAEGYRALRGGKFEDAEDRLEKALSVDPRNPFCYLYLAEIRSREGETRQAIILLHQAEVLFQGHPYWLGEVYTREGRYWEALDSWDEARAAYSKALQHNPWNEESKRKMQ